MQLSSLAELAKYLVPTEQCRFVDRGITQDAPFDHHAQHPEKLGIDAVFRNIEEPGSWIALYNVETHPAYKAFLEQVVDSVRPMVEREEGKIFLVCGFIFISAPPSVTPFHIDRENNFWLQLRGRKTINVWRHSDRVAVAAADVDNFIVHASRDNVELRDGLVERSEQFDVGPGEGVYFPSTSPHMTRSDRSWTTPDNGISISIGVVFYTDYTRFLAYVHICNLVMRRIGLTPSEPGSSSIRDRLKYLCGVVLFWLKRTFRGYKPQLGM